jgi:hypothetical protein
MVLDERQSRVGWTKVVSIVILCAALVALSAAPSSGTGFGLTGAWNVTIVLDDGSILCTTPSLNTADGGVVAQGCGVNTSPGYGQWRRVGLNRFAVTFVGVDFGPPEGGIVDTYKVRATVRLSQDGQTFTGPFRTEIFTLDGTLLVFFTGVVTAQRIVIEPL